MSSTVSSVPHDAGERFATAPLVRAAGVALVGSVAGVLAVRGITGALVDVPGAFTPLKIASIVSLTVLGVIAATLFALLLNRLSARPSATYRRVVPIAVVVSLVPDIVIWASNAYAGTARASTVLPLMVMHLVVASVCLVVIPRLGARAVR